MAIISNIAFREEKHRGDDQGFVHIESSPALPADSVELSDLPPFIPHGFIGVQMFDADGDLVVAGAGTFTITVKTLNTKQFEAIPDSPINATAPETLSWAANVTDIRVVAAGLTGVVTWKVVVTLNRS